MAKHNFQKFKDMTHSNTEWTSVKTDELFTKEINKAIKFQRIFKEVEFT